MKSLEDLKALRDKARADMGIRKDTDDNDVTRVVVGMATCGIAAGARPVLQALVDSVAKESLENVVVGQTGCIGICDFEPIVEVYSPNQEKVTYTHMTSERALEVVEKHLKGGKIVAEYTIGSQAK